MRRRTVDTTAPVFHRPKRHAKVRSEGSFYNQYATADLRQRHEIRANKWAFRRVIPLREFDDAIAEGHTELWDLADHFGVTEDFMRKAVCLYVHGNLAADLYF